jgi:hypothetical protein
MTTNVCLYLNTIIVVGSVADFGGPIHTVKLLRVREAAYPPPRSTQAECLEAAARCQARADAASDQTAKEDFLE